jgi:group I intron endonuclease
MYKLYKITNKINGKRYFGITKTSLKQRWNMHRYSSKTGKHYLACAMRSYGIENFHIELIQEFESEEECCLAEQEAIKQNSGLYNLAVGGQTGFSMRRKSPEEFSLWVESLKRARAGRTPALGMKHSDENKKLFGEFGKLRWEIYGRYPDDVTRLSFKEAHETYGISKTHYYRLRNKSNELV